METPFLAAKAAVFWLGVRIEVFPERDGNQQQQGSGGVLVNFVRIEVFPERDGNIIDTILAMFSARSSPNRGLP